tara:strand:- start:38 stop:604 length:567 start_codon:yes stop_codon:yes gene_type:complete
MALTKVRDGGTDFTGAISSHQLLASSVSTSTVTEVDITLPTGYDNYYLHIIAKGDESSSTNFQLQDKMDGDSSFTTSDYTTQVKLMDVTNNQTNTNSGGSNKLLSTASGSDSNYSHNIFLNGYGRTDVASSISGTSTKGLSSASATWVFGGSHTTEATSLKKVVEVRYKPSQGNIVQMYYKLYGIVST